MSDLAPLSVDLTLDTDALSAGTSAKVAIGVAPFAGTITAATYYPTANIVGADTNSRTLTIEDGATVAATLALTNGVNATALTGEAIPLSGTAANLNVAAGDVIAFHSAAVGTGLADPGGLVKVTITRS